jgi:ubiquinol-cytochrome c reductase cytochrome b subunit
MVVLVGLHMLRVFIWGAYKKPREMTWLIGVILLLLTVALSFTGAALPWDERGFWATEVGTSIAGTVPIIGTSIKHLLIGGSKIGQLTLSRFFIFHTAIIPGIAILLIIIHLVAFRKFGSVGPWSEEKRKIKSSFWPEQVTKDMIVAVLIFLLLVTLSVFKPPPFTGPADQLDTTFNPKPEWNFLFLYQSLKFFPGALEKLGTVGIPTIIVLIFFSLPFFDRKSERNPLKRPVMMTGGLIFLILLLSLTVMGYNSGLNQSQQELNPHSTSKTNSSNVKRFKLSASALRGKNNYNNFGCTSCHTMSGNGGKVGPDLTNEEQRGHTKSWIIVQIKNPQMHNPKSPMPPFALLDSTQVSDLADYLLSPHPAHEQNENNQNTANSEETKQPAISEADTSGIKNSKNISAASAVGSAAGMIGNVSHGALLFSQDCESCHGVNGKGGIPDPGSKSGIVPALNPISNNLYSKNPEIFANNIDRIIQHGSTPPGPNPQLHMLAFGDSHTLTQQEIANIEAYVLDLNKVNRAEIQITPYIPLEYYFIVAGIFLFIILIIIIIGFRRAKS